MLCKEKEAANFHSKQGFTVVEVIVAASLMIILCIGLLSVFSYVVKINRGDNMRSQAQSVLQQEIEYYRSLRFVPGNLTTADLANHRVSELRGSTTGITYNRPARLSADQNPMSFNITVKVTNLSFFPTSATDEVNCTFKQIEITATPTNAQSGWLSDLNTKVVIQRVRSN